MRLKTTMKLVTLLVTALAMGAIAAGCGSDDDDDSSDSSEPTASAATDSGITKAELLAQGNQICKEGTQEIDAGFGELGDQPSDAEIEAAASETLVPSIQGQIDDIRALGEPDGDGEITEILDEAQAALDELEADPSVITGPDADPFADVNKKLAAYGLTACA